MAISPGTSCSAPLVTRTAHPTSQGDPSRPLGRLQSRDPQRAEGEEGEKRSLAPAGGNVKGWASGKVWQLLKRLPQSYHITRQVPSWEQHPRERAVHVRTQTTQSGPRGEPACAPHLTKGYTKRGISTPRNIDYPATNRNEGRMLLQREGTLNACSAKEARHHRPHSVRFHLYEKSRTGKPLVTGSGARGWERGQGGVTANGLGVLWG